LKLFYCPTCRRVYYLDEGSVYLCGRKHSPAPSLDGRIRKFNITEWSESNQPPWSIPAVVESRELFQQDMTEMWLSECKNPRDKDYGNVSRHFGYGAPGGKHLTQEEVVGAYSDYVLNLVQT
jgi:hypothetical protein